MSATDKIIELGAHTRMTPGQALGLMQREEPKSVLILFMGADEKIGIRSSAMSNKDALWLIECGRSLIMNGDFDDDEDE
jgi:hypothetical protein